MNPADETADNATIRLSEPPPVSRVFGFMAWASQAGLAAVYLAVLVQPVGWHAMYATDPVGAVTLWVFAASMAFVWATCLWMEQKNFYDRNSQVFFRKVGLLGHVSVLLVSLLAALAQPSRAALLVILPVLATFATGVWFIWMRTLFLPPEDQAVIDAITDREAKQRAAARDAANREIRQHRLNGIVTKLGYQLTDTAIQDDEGPVRWQIPAGKHAPLVYFLRNGDRVKIGTTTDLRSRIRRLALRPENVALILGGGREREQALHRQFAAQRVGNSEWFRYADPLAQFITDETAKIRSAQQH